MRKKGTTMNITEKQQKKAAKEFAEYWKDKGYEKGQSLKFWIDLLQNVYGVENATGTSQGTSGKRFRRDGCLRL